MPTNPAKSARDLMRLQVDEHLTRWRSARLPPRPRDGWVRTIRNALGMTARVLGDRLDLTERGVRKLEESEANGSISLANLRKVAEALDCDLQYALVPRKQLEDVLLDRAREVARRELAPVSHSMALEQQGVSAEGLRRQIEAWARALVSNGSSRDLWS